MVDIAGQENARKAEATARGGGKVCECTLWTAVKDWTVWTACQLIIGLIAQHVCGKLQNMPHTAVWCFISLHNPDHCYSFFNRRFASTTGMYKDEQERRRIYTEILEYEQDVVSIWYRTTAKDLINMEVLNKRVIVNSTKCQTLWFHAW